MILKKDLMSCESITSTAGIKDIEYRVSTDSRTFKGSNLFISLFGDNFDSINFVRDVFEAGCELAILENREQNQSEIKSLQKEIGESRVVLVENVFKFILELGRARSLRFRSEGGVVIGLTGSNGKTTNKEMLRHMLTVFPDGDVLATKGNLNNQIGVPLTLFEINQEHKVAVVEMGTNFPGEIKILAECAKPQYGFITNIGYAHIEFLGSLEGVLKEKSALLDEVVKHNNGLFLINGFDDLLKSHEGKQKTEILKPKDVTFLPNGLSINLSGNTYQIENPHLLGEHQKINMAMCLTLLSRIYPQKTTEIVEKAKSYSPPGMNRGEILKQGDLTIYLDAYNANPSSMEASLNSYAEYLKSEGKSLVDSVIVLGDMNELGPDGPSLHKKIGERVKQMGGRVAYFVGRYAKNYEEGFGSGSVVFESTAKLRDFLDSHDWPLSNVFIKGSRSLQLESIIDITSR